MRGYGFLCAALIGAYPVLPPTWRHIDFLVVCASALVCIAYGRYRVQPRRRLPWTLLLAGLTAILIASAVQLVPYPWVDTAGLLLDAVGNVLVLWSALALIVRRGSSDLGGIIDTTIISLAAGGLLWGVLLPHRLGLDRSMAAEVDLFVSVFALTGVVGALLRLSRVVADPGLALWWLVAALGSGIGANVTLAYAGGDGALRILADMFFVAGFVALGLFGLDPAAPRLARSGGAPEAAGASAADRLSIGRLIFLGLSVAVTPVVIGVREVGGGNVGGLLLAVQGALVAALVMTRIGLLARQRAAAEQALNYQATHDPLTRLPNRREFVDRLRGTLARGNRCLLLFCDLDDFKSINDQFGHDAGDQFLVEVADRLRTCISRPHVVSRFGGDEFVILLVNASLADGRAAQSCIVHALSRPSAQSGAPIRVSIGISTESDSRGPEDLIRAADHAMYRVKAGRSRSSAEAPRYAYDSRGG